MRSVVAGRVEVFPADIVRVKTPVPPENVIPSLATVEHVKTVWVSSSVDFHFAMKRTSEETVGAVATPEEFFRVFWAVKVRPRVMVKGVLSQKIRAVNVEVRVRSCQHRHRPLPGRT